MIIYFMLTKQPLIHQRSKAEIISQIQNVQCTYPKRISSKISSFAKDFVEALLIKEPASRPTAYQALQHIWVYKFSRSMLHTLSSS